MNALAVADSKENDDVRKTLKDRAEVIISLLVEKRGKEEPEPLYRADLKKAGFDYPSANKWMELLIYLQDIFKDNELVVNEAGRFITYELVSKERKNLD
ncbi:MAG: hypothetical protein ACFFD4_07905 [Candidatus Odinarchaeota archaeon]